MTRPRGGIIGAKPIWTTTATSGIFSLGDVADLKGAAQWPRGPVAPTSLAGTAGNEQVVLTWTAPATTHGTITDYVVEYTAAGDPFFSSVSLLAPLDSDTTSVVGGVTPTVSGTAMTISPSDGKYGGYATNTVSTSTTTYATSFGNGDWTVECWIRRDSFFSTNPRIIDLGSVELEPGTNQTINFYYRPTDTNFSSSTFLTTQGQWHHIAIVYQSGVLRSYVDGVQRGSLTQAVTPPTSVQLTNTCSFDDLRVTASAVYPDGTTFTPPTSAHATSGSGSPTVVATGSTAASYTLTGLTNDTEYTFRVAAVNHTQGEWSATATATPTQNAAPPNTELMLNMNNSLADASQNNYVFNSTHSLNPGFDSTNKVFGSHSRIYQPYYSDSLSNQGAAVVSMFTGDFTVECFYRLNSGVLGNTIYAGGVWGVLDLTGNSFDNMALYIDTYSSNYIAFSWYNGASSSGSIYSTTAMIDDGAFRHLAVVREGTTFRVYYDGNRIIENTSANNADPWTTPSLMLSVGVDPYMAGYDGTDGNIDDFRISSAALYSGATINVPTSELT